MRVLFKTFLLSVYTIRKIISFQKHLGDIHQNNTIMLSKQLTCVTLLHSTQLHWEACKNKQRAIKNHVLTSLCSI